MIVNIIINNDNNIIDNINNINKNINNKIEYINYIIDYNEEDLYNLLPEYIIKNIWEPYEYIINNLNSNNNNIKIILCYNNNIESNIYQWIINKIKLINIKYENL